MTHDIIDFVRVTRELVDAEESFVTVTLVEIRGSAPQVVGAKAIITENGLVSGTIGGGKVEAAAIDFAQKMLEKSDVSHVLQTWNLQTDIGMTCGGEVKLFFEAFRRTVWPIAVFGAGHVAQSLVPLLCGLNCRVTCIDPRNEWLARMAEHPKLKKVCLEHPVEMVDRLPSRTFFVLMSKGHMTDLPVVKRILEIHEPPYLGVIGSRQKASVLRRELRESGFEEEKIRKIRCPIGLPFGNNTPAEIAISVAGQLIQVRDELGVLPHPRKNFSPE